MKLKEKAEKLKTDIPAVFIALTQKSTPWYAKIIAGLTIAYALSPIDFIPDFIPVLGYLDDLIILPLMVALTIRLIPAAVLTECREKSKNLWANGKPKKWYYAIPIVLIWLLILFLILKAFIK
ncbi:MAG: YkvA family protein [Oscillospiraceae bacterium]